MKTKIEKLEDVYKACKSEGFIRPKEKIDIEIIKSLFETSCQGFERLENYDFLFEKRTNNFAFVFRDNYEILRMLIDAYLYFDKVDIGNHQCSNAYICMKHPELDFSWKTLETMRILRNAINYEGKKIDKKIWEMYKLRFEIYIKTFIKEVEQKIKEHKIT